MILTSAATQSNLSPEQFINLTHSLESILLPEKIATTTIIAAIFGVEDAVDAITSEVLSSFGVDDEPCYALLEFLTIHLPGSLFHKTMFKRAWSGNRHNWVYGAYIGEMPDFLLRMVDAGGTRPVGLPPMVTVYRGGVGPDVASGWSWTLRRDVAERFSTYAAAGGVRLGHKEPVVIAAEVPVERILHFDDERQEAECVIPYGI